jgi:hypothetical protein
MNTDECRIIVIAALIEDCRRKGYVVTFPISS